MQNWLHNLKNAWHPAGNGAHDPQDADLPPMPSERSTGLVFAAVAIIVAVLFRSEGHIFAASLAMAACFAGVAILAPRWLAPINRAWFALALLLNRVVSPVIMLVLFAVLIVPAGLAMQMRRDPLRASRDRDATSYWIDRSTTARPGSMHDQF